MQQHQLATECRVFGDKSAAEFCGISQIAPWNLAKFATDNNGGPTYYIKKAYLHCES